MADSKNLKPGWKVWRFDQMATNVNVRIDNPAESGMEHYVGLEHLDSDSLKIRRWGSPSDVESTKLCFKKGDIIFGKRRAYQRKLGVAEFDGICSAHAMVLRAKPEVVLSEFLPFFMQSEPFMNRAVEISVGSLSPTINWKTFSAERFSIPEIEEQERVIYVLRAAEEVVSSCRSALESALALHQSHVDESFRSSDLSPINLQDLCSLPITYGIVQAGPHIEDGVPYIRVSDMTAGQDLQLEGMLRTSAEIAKKFHRSAVSHGDIVFALRGDVGLCRIVPPVLDGANLTQGTARLSVAPHVSRDYVFWALQSTEVKRQIERAAKGSTFKEITLASLRKLEIKVADPKVQNEVASKLAKSARSLEAISLRLETAKELYCKLRQNCLEV